MNTAPKISVVMGVYNGARYLREAVDSILAQTFADFEFLIIDDGSTDDTPGILAQYRDPRIRVVTNGHNEGLTRCLIKGCDEARGEYIARMDADDVSHVERFERQVAFLDAHVACGVVGSFCQFIDPAGHGFGNLTYPLEHEAILHYMEIFNPLVHGSVMFRADAYRNIGGYREFFRLAQDFDLWLRFREHSRLANLPDLLYMHRYHGNKMGIKNIDAQNTYVQLARKFTEIRKKSGADPLMQSDRASIDNMIRALTPAGFWAKRKARSQQHAETAHNLYHAGLQLVHIRRLLLHAFINNPFNETLWKLILSPEFRNRNVRAIKRRLPGPWSEKRETG